MYLDHQVNLTLQAVAVLSSYNDPASIFCTQEYDQKFVRILSIATYSTENFKNRDFAPAKRKFMQKIFEIRVANNVRRENQFYDLFAQAMKEGIARNVQKAAKLSKISLPDNIFN